MGYCLSKPKPFGSQLSYQKANTKTSDQRIDQNNLFPIQTIIHDYLFLQKLSKGNNEAVYLVESTSKKEKFTAHVLKLQTWNKKQIVENGLRLSQLKHINLVNVKEYFLEYSERYLVLVMEYCSKGNLIEQLKKIHCDKNYLNKILIQLAEGVQYLHQEKIIHRYLKPKHIFFNYQGEVKIKITQTFLKDKSLSAKFDYHRALEDFQSTRHSFEVDIWSLGILFFEIILGVNVKQMITGTELPFENKDFPSIKQLGKIQNSQYRELLRLMLNKDPQKRINIHQVLTKLDGRPLKIQTEIKLNLTTKSGETQNPYLSIIKENQKKSPTKFPTKKTSSQKIQEEERMQKRKKIEERIKQETLLRQRQQQEQEQFNFALSQSLVAFKEYKDKQKKQKQKLQKNAKREERNSEKQKKIENQRQKDKQIKNQLSQCCICLDEKREMIGSCFHISVCFKCSEKINCCPICKTETKWNKVYIP